MTSENKLVLKSINQLFEHSFFIPSYQRGYRWTDVQVKQLLDDIWNFAKNPLKAEENEEKPFYCLQPIVVRSHGQQHTEWEVIDGQQRLTTIYLILKNLENQIERTQKNFSRIFYETRADSEVYLNSLNAEDSQHNIDYFHIYEANKTIQNWFQTKADTTEDASPKAIFAPVFLTNTKVVWYEANEANTDPIEIFTRINMGKIPLTNAELIKALFLQKDNFKEGQNTLKQIQIASEWDLIEKTLQDDDFWYFIYNPSNPINYDNRIEYVFDLMKDKKNEHEYYYTFNRFLSDFASKSIQGKPDIDSIWLDIKKYFLTFDEWFRNHELYHLVGYLIDCNYSIETLKSASDSKDKVAFKKRLKKLISEQVNFDIDDLEYGKGSSKIRKVLLLLNIQTILGSSKDETRFPFYKYKLDKWDIEHIRSKTTKQILPGDRKDWALDVLEYFTGINGYGSDTDIGLQREEVQQMTDNELDEAAFCKSFLSILDGIILTDEQFDKLYSEVSKYFKEDIESKNPNSISNLALLDAKTNRSYKNAMFPIKRKRIIGNDMNGLFVPISTKNVFMKFHTKKLNDVMYWKDSDAADYLSAIKTTLIQYLPKN